MAFFECVDNHHPYPKDKFEYKCPECGSAYDLVGGINYRPELVDSNQPGLWKYKHTFGLPEIAPTIYLGEGNTPLVETRIENKQVYFKLESLNPTGSFKDRINAVNMSFLVSRGIQAAVEDSSGNAGASFSAYASRAGLDGKVFVPSYASGPKRKQIEAYGAELVLVPGPRLEATKAVLQAVEEEGSAYASHVYLPHGILGLATTAYEIYDQLGEAPGSIITPVGQGSLLLGIIRGFEALYKLGIIGNMPVPVGVQAKVCAPYWSLFFEGPESLRGIIEEDTLAEGVRIRSPLFIDRLMPLVKKWNGKIVAVEEDEILPGMQNLSKRGFYAEPTSAIVWDALMQVSNNIPEPIVVILTGSGLKSVM